MFINMVNTALQTTYYTLRAFNPGVFENPSVCVAPYLDFDSITNRVILHAEQTRYDETYTSIANNALNNIYVYKRLFDLFIGMQNTHVSKDGDLNYHMRVIYNNSNLVKRTVLDNDPNTNAARSNVVPFCADVSRSI